ncbi:hypothetical protein ACA910_001358 [Epithemia clementina (nom. ined.)]
MLSRLETGNAILIAKLSRKTSFFQQRKRQHYPKVIQLQVQDNRMPGSTKVDEGNGNLVTVILRPLHGKESRKLVSPMISKRRTAKINRSDDYEQASSDTLETTDCKIQHAWQKESKPNCNSVHEYDMTQVKILNHGYWRDVWKVPSTSRKHPAQAEAVLKTQRFEHGFSERSNIERHRVDAMVMEHHTSSPWIMNVYGVCATSSISEFAPNGSLRERIWPSSGDSYDDDESEDSPPDKFEMLWLAIQATMGISDLHDYDSKGRAAIAHSDIKPEQFVFTRTGTLKLNDFNIARFLRFNPTTKEICPYSYDSHPGTSRSPEEFSNGPETDKVDIFHLGNIFYALLTRSWPFGNLSHKEAKLIVEKGGRPPLPPSIKNSRDPIHKILVRAMKMCQRQNPQDRANAREVERYLIKKTNAFAPDKLIEWGIQERAMMSLSR